MSYPMNIRLPDEMKTLLQREADESHRTLSNLIKAILSNYLYKKVNNDKPDPESSSS